MYINTRTKTESPINSYCFLLEYLVFERALVFNLQAQTIKATPWSENKIQDGVTSKFTFNIDECVGRLFL